MEEYIKQLLSEVELKSRKQYTTDPYGFLPDTFDYLSYWNHYRNEWTFKERALEGYILSKLTPIINNLIKQNHA